MLDEPREVLEDFALTAMKRKAEELGVKGVANVLIIEDGQTDIRPVFRPCGRIERDPDPSRDKPDQKDTGTNYLSVVWTKNAEVISTLQPESGKGIREPKFGEFGLRGCLRTRTMTAYIQTSFSGGTEDQDTEIALAGMKALHEA